MSKFRQGPKLYDEAMKAVREGNSAEAFELLERLRVLLDLSEEDFSMMIGQGHTGPSFKPEVDLDALDVIDLDAPIIGQAKGGAIERLKRWVVYDPKEDRVVSKPYKDKRRARSRVDKLDNDYGAYRYRLKELMEDGTLKTTLSKGGKVIDMQEALARLRASKEGHEYSGDPEFEEWYQKFRRELNERENAKQAEIDALDYAFGIGDFAVSKHSGKRFEILFKTTDKDGKPAYHVRGPDGEEHVMSEWGMELAGPRKGFKEGGKAEKDRPAKKFMQEVFASMFGATPFVGEEAALVGRDVGEHAYNLGAIPVAGFKTQWWGKNPTTGELEYAGPLSAAMHGRARPPYPDEELLGIDPAMYREQYEAWRDFEPDTGPIPGIVDETVALPQLLELATLGNVPSPEISKVAGDRIMETEEMVLDDMGIDQPSGLLENILYSGGIMGGQLPVPAALLNRAKAPLRAAAGWMNRAKRSPGIVGRAGVEFLSPIIDPKFKNYLAGALFGGGLMTGIEHFMNYVENQGVPAGMPPDIVALIEAAENGDRGAYEKLKSLYNEMLVQQERAAEYRESPAFQESQEFLIQGGPMAKGGKVNRRDVLKGLVATGAVGAGALKAGRHSGVDVEDVGDALRRIDEGMRSTAVPARGFKYSDVPESLRKKIDEIIGVELENLYDLARDDAESAIHMGDSVRAGESIPPLGEIDPDTPFTSEQVDFLEDALDLALDDPDLHELYDMDHVEVTEVLNRLRGMPEDEIGRLKQLETPERRNLIIDEEGDLHNVYWRGKDGQLYQGVARVDLGRDPYGTIKDFLKERGDELVSFQSGRSLPKE